MKNLSKRITIWNMRRRYKAILQDRIDLTDYEREQLIPEIKSRLEILKEYFNSILTICDNHKNSVLFKNNLSEIISSKGFPLQADDASSLSEKFFAQIIDKAQTENIDGINGILKKYEYIDNINKLGLFLTEVNFLCLSFLEVKNKLFLYKIEAYPHVLDTSTGETTVNKPNQFYLTIEPFEITIENILSVCKATSDTIHEWHRQTMEMKSKFLNLHNNKINLRNSRIILLIQVITIILTIALSSFFLTANDPFSLVKKNLSLKNKVDVITIEKQALKEQLMQLKNAKKVRNSK